MEREIMPDHAAEEFYRYLIPRSAFEAPEEPQKETDHCVVFCKKVAPNVFDIRKGIAVVDGTKEYFNDGICMITSSTKVVFVIEEAFKTEASDAEYIKKKISIQNYRAGLSGL